jgi:hypothetical protein
MDEIKERFWAFMGGIAKQNEKSRSASVELQVMRICYFRYRLLCRSLKRCGLSKVDPRLERMKPLPPSGNLPGVWLRTFTSVSDVAETITYLQNQAEHHRLRSFQEEYVSF